jgi:2-polyprenyl-6-methoxyphenol hydroxylase-like FAD-dependent oxidoreductase
MRVLVAGAGIGGLATALSLHDAGIEVELVESARCIDAVGAGINLLPHAVRELTELRLGGVLEATGVPTSELVYHDRFGSRIWSEPRGRAAGYRWPQYSIHRGELQLLLLRAVQERLGAEAVRCGVALEGFDQSADRATAVAAGVARSTPTCSSAPTESTPRSAHSCTQARVARAGPGSACGAASARPSRSSRAAR